jgi:O-antigen ligase
MALALGAGWFGGITRGADLTLHVAATALALWLARPRAVSRRTFPLLPLVLAISVLGLAHALAALLIPGPFAEVAELPSPGLEARPWEPTVRAAAAWIRFGVLLTVGWLIGRHRRQRRWLTAAIGAVAAFQVLYGMPRWFAASSEIWGRSVAGDGSRLRGTFVNPDHFALFVAMAAAVVFASTWAIARNTRFGPLDQRIVVLVGPIALWTVLFVAVAFSGSRAGLAALLAATLAQGFLIGRRRILHRLVGLAAIGLGLAVVARIGLRQGLGRLLGTSAHELTINARLEAAKAGFELWLESPWFGVGLGGFRATFPSVQPQSLSGAWRHVHNDWLELLICTGIVGVLVLAVGVGASIRSLLRCGIPERSEDRAALVAAVGVLVVCGLHELLDFGLTMPANQLLLATALGAGVAALADHRQPEPEVLAEASD